MTISDNTKAFYGVLFAVAAALVCGLMLGAALTMISSLPLVGQ